jgi:hypothetical protein
MSDIEQRLRRLEAVEEIRALKARYLGSCDAKDPETMRSCFCDGPVTIDFGRVGVYETADALVDIFRQLGCNDWVVEMHHGVNPRIDVAAGGDRASGQWGLHYQMINTRDLTLTQLGAVYEDEYRRTPQGWKIAASKCIVTSTLVIQLSQDAVKAIFAGRQAPAAVDDPSKQAA